MKLYYRSKILINGLWPMKDYKYNDYSEKTGMFNDKLMDADQEDYIFYASNNLIRSSYQEKGSTQIKYEYFENDNLLCIDVNEKLISDKNKLTEFLLNNFIEEVSNMEMNLRLMTNFDIGLPIFKVSFYLESGDNFDVIPFVGYVNAYSPNLFISNYSEDKKNLLNNRLHFHISNESLIALSNDNSRFKRAIDFFNESFTTRTIQVKFVLLFSALESLFNLQNPDEEDNSKSLTITEMIVENTKKILLLNSNLSATKKKRIGNKIADFYKRRSFYIHGNNPLEINNKYEFDLREIVRETIIIYWYISIRNKFTTSEDVVKYLNENHSDNPFIKIFVDSLHITSYDDFYHNTIQTFLNNNENDTVN